MAGNRIELWGRVLGEPELRITPAGTSVLRIRVDTADGSGGLALAAVMTGENASRLRAGLKAGTEVRVKGSLKAVRRRLQSGLVETAYEVMAESMEIEGPAQRGD
jgi:single-stranded DNA-binding protein